jgi:hypothetical protein
MNKMRFRWGKASPVLSNSGIESAEARETTPLIPGPADKQRPSPSGVAICRGDIPADEHREHYSKHRKTNACNDDHQCNNKAVPDRFRQ